MSWWFCFLKAWSEQRRVAVPKKRLELINSLKKNNRRIKLPNTVTIDSIYEKKFIALNSVLEVVIIDAHVLPGTLKSKHFLVLVYCMVKKHGCSKHFRILSRISMLSVHLILSTVWRRFKTCHIPMENVDCSTYMTYRWGTILSIVFN